MTLISQIRRQKVRAQQGMCFYCRQPMWEGCPGPFAARYGLKGPRLLWLQATAEHLHARCEGGPDRIDNIVAACKYCNTRRHFCRVPPTPEEHAIKVQQRLEAGKWHGLSLRK